MRRYTHRLAGDGLRRGAIGPSWDCLSLLRGRTRLFRGRLGTPGSHVGPIGGRLGTPGRHVGPIRGRPGRARGPVSLLRVPFRTVRRAVQPVRGDADRLGAVPRRPARSRRAAIGTAVTRAAAPAVPIVPGTVGRLPG